MSMVPKDPGSSEATDRTSPDERKGISRRALLTGAAGAAAALVAGAVAAKAQVTGVTPGGGAIPMRLPDGALNFLDRQQYINNMEVISFTPGVTVSVGEPLMSMWARGKQRLLPGGGGWLDISDPKNPVLIGGRARGAAPDATGRGGRGRG